MAEYGEWNRKGVRLSELTAKTEYGVSREFIINGIETGKLEFKEGAIWGNPYFKIFRSQLEKFITERLGKDYLESAQRQTELRRVNKEISQLKKKLVELQNRKAYLEESLKETGSWPINRNGSELES